MAQRQRASVVVAVAVMVLFVVVADAAAQASGDTHLFPVISATPGLGTPPTRWVSDATVHNQTEVTVTVGFQLFPEGGPNQLDPSFAGDLSTVLQLGPRATVTLENIVEEGSGVTGAIKGMLLVSCSSSFFPVDGNPDGTGDAEFLPGVPSQRLDCDGD